MSKFDLHLTMDVEWGEGFTNLITQMLNLEATRMEDAMKRATALGCGLMVIVHDYHTKYFADTSLAPGTIVKAAGRGAVMFSHPDGTDEFKLEEIVPKESSGTHGFMDGVELDPMTYGKEWATCKTCWALIVLQSEHWVHSITKSRFCDKDPLTEASPYFTLQQRVRLADES